MAIKIARMQSGEDVIADIKEIRESAESTKALAYEFEGAFTIQIMQNPEDYFQEENVDPIESLLDMQIQFFPWSPLTKGRNLVTLLSVVAISDPHERVMQGYQEVLEKFKKLNTDDAKIDYSQTPPTNLLVGESAGDG